MKKNWVLNIALLMILVVIWFAIYFKYQKRLLQKLELKQYYVIELDDLMYLFKGNST